MSGRIIREGDQGGRMTILGKVKVGKKSEKGFPTSLDYFIATGKYAGLFDKVYGDRPDRLEICFHSDDIGQVCNEEYECRDREGKRVAYGDGESFHLYDAGKKEYIIVRKEDLPKGLGTWSTTLTLRFILLRVNTVFGLWQFTTKGEKSSIPAIRDTFDAVKQQAGTVLHVPFDLIVEKVSSQKPGEKRTFPVVSLIANIGSQELQLLGEYIEKGGQLKGIVSQGQIEQLAADSGMKLLGGGDDIEIV
jgi:recombination directionality factor gp3-like protein